jgi:pimeloyl-ACP methyl ester carboxylesterase
MPDEELEGQTFVCSYLVVPENRMQPNGQTIRLMVAEIFSTSETPEPDPVIYLSGGPGQNAVGEAAGWISAPFLGNRDLILFDQRGTGNSEPTLNCPEIEEMDDNTTEIEATQACYERLTSEGINLSAYNSAESAADVNDLRLALGYEQVNLFGISYGTRLALTVVRDYPEGIRSVILDSVYPPVLNALETQAGDALRALDVLFDACEVDPSCLMAYPYLDTMFIDTVDRLNTAPATYQWENPDTGEMEEVTLSGNDLLSTVVQALYHSDAIPYLPLVIAEVADGNYAIYDDLVSEALYTAEDDEAAIEESDEPGEDISDSEGAYYSVECHEEFPFNNRETAIANAEIILPRLRDGLLEASEVVFDVCNFWQTGTVDEIETAPVISDIPTLILTGEYDPITPPASGQLAAETLSNSFYFEFPGVGHDVFDSSPCPADMAAAFVDDPYTEPDATCMNEIMSPEFVLP